MKITLIRRLFWGLGGLWIPAYCVLLTLAPRWVPGRWQGALLALSFPLLLMLPVFLFGLAYAHSFPGETWAPHRWRAYQNRAGVMAVVLVVLWLMVAPPAVLDPAGDDRGVDRTPPPAGYFAPPQTT